MHVHFHITRKTLLWGFVGIILCASVYSVVSEEFKMTAFYPSPYGIYSKLISTQGSYFARDSGSVGIGTTNPGQKLDVSGNVLLSKGRAAIITTGDNTTTHRGGVQFLTYDNGVHTILTPTDQNGNSVDSNLSLGGLGAFNNNTVNLGVSGSANIGKNVTLGGGLQLGIGSGISSPTKGMLSLDSNGNAQIWDGSAWKPLGGSGGSTGCPGPSGTVCTIAGTNPTCPAGATMGGMGKYWTSAGCVATMRTDCGSANSNPWSRCTCASSANYGGEAALSCNACNTGTGWGLSPLTCGYRQVYFSTCRTNSGYSCGGAVATCTASNWTQIQCVVQ